MNMKTIGWLASCILVGVCLGCQPKSETEPSPQPISEVQDDESVRNGKTFEQWMSQTKDKNPTLQREAICELISFRMRAVPSLIEMLGNDDPDFCMTAAYALGKIGPEAKSAIPALVGLLKATETQVQETAAVALGRICEVKLPKLAQCPEDTGDAKNSDAWRLAVIVLLTTGLHTEITTPIHRGLINEEKVQSAIELATHLGYLGETGATSVAKLLKDKDVVFRRKVVQVLGKMGSLAVPALTDTLKDPDWETRWWATRTLRALGPRAKAAVPALMELLKDQEHWVGGGEVAAALKWIGLDVKTDVPVLIDTLKHPEPSVRVEAANILANLGPSGSAATAALKESFKDENGFVRAHAALAVWQITAEANTIVPLLINLLDHNDRDVRHIAAYALGRIGRAAEPAIPALVKRFDDEYHVNVVAASKALGRIGPASIPAVVRFLNAQGKSPWARKQAVFSLWQMGSVAVPSLEKLVQDKDKEVRQTASEALKIIEEFKGTPPPMPGGRT